MGKLASKAPRASRGACFVRKDAQE